MGSIPIAARGAALDEKACGMAARVGYPSGEFDPLALSGQQFRKAVDPAGSDSVSGGGINDLRVLIGDQLHCLPGSLVGQAQEQPGRPR